MNILVTGSKGVIGSWLTAKLSERGHDVFCLYLTHSVGEVGYVQRMDRNAFTYSRCDISDFRQVERIFESKKFDYVFNCAAEFGRWNGEDFYEQVWRSNAIGLKNILRLQEALQFKLIHFSSSEVYGDYPDIMHEHVMDTIEIPQMNDYALSKWVNEQQIRNSAELYGTQTVVVRIFNTYGPGEYYHPYRSVNSKFCYNLLHGKQIDLFTGHKRTSTFLEDSVTTISNIVENFKPGETYNIGGSELHTIEELVEVILGKTGASEKLVTVHKENEKLTTKDKIVDVSKSISDLNHTNSVSLDEGVELTVKWMKSIYGI